ncbi:MAG: hypothetical protein IKA84_03635 [Clostridia bacterium]|nr:hypothetical protein [Clostridia bacterium]
MKQKRIIKLAALLILVLIVLFSLSACSFFEDYNINSVGDFFSFLGFLFTSLLVKIFVVPIMTLVEFIGSIF